MSQAQLLFFLFFPCCCLPSLSISSFVSTSINKKRIKRSSPAPDNDVLSVTTRPDFASLHRTRQKWNALPDDAPGKAEKRTPETTRQTFFCATKEQARSPGSGLEGWMRAELLWSKCLVYTVAGGGGSRSGRRRLLR